MTATITTIDHHKRQAVAEFWDALGEDSFFGDFIKAHRLASAVDPESTAELMRDFQPTSMNHAIRVYQGLLKIAGDAVNEKLNQSAANDD
jgi:hypothetical protein